jgi:hypothetical protein
MLQVLDLSDCSINDDDLKQLRGFPLQRLGVEGTNVSEQTKSNLDSLWQIQQPIDAALGSSDDGR